MSLSYRGRIPNELQRTLGYVTTEEQVAKASKFHAGLRSSTDKHKNERRAWETFLQKSANVDGVRAWEEILLYRAIAHASAFFVPEQVRAASMWSS